MPTKSKSWTTTKVDRHGSRRTCRPFIEARTGCPQAQCQPIVARYRHSLGPRPRLRNGWGRRMRRRFNRQGRTRFGIFRLCVLPQLRLKPCRISFLSIVHESIYIQSSQPKYNFDNSLNFKMGSVYYKEHYHLFIFIFIYDQSIVDIRCASGENFKSTFFKVKLYFTQ